MVIRKNTNPKLSETGFTQFSQVSSCGTATAISVPCMFSGMPREDYDEQLASHREGLLDIAKRAGYQSDMGLIITQGVRGMRSS